jgi:hypothetical protein
VFLGWKLDWPELRLSAREFDFNLMRSIPARFHDYRVALCGAAALEILQGELDANADRQGGAKYASTRHHELCARLIFAAKLIANLHRQGNGDSDRPLDARPLAWRSGIGNTADRLIGIEC